MLNQSLPNVWVWVPSHNNFLTPISPKGTEADTKILEATHHHHHPTTLKHEGGVQQQNSVSRNI